MPRISRFLLGDWLKVKHVSFDEKQSFGEASYKDYFGCEHNRKVSLTETSLTINDHVRGMRNKAVLRWRLNSDNWTLKGNKVTNGHHEITIESDVKIERFEIVEGRESRYYYQEASIPVIEVEISSDGNFKTEYKFHI